MKAERLLRRLAPGVALAALAVSPAGPALAQEAAPDGGNTAWILTATALVLFMTMPGLALFYGGLVRASNVLSVLLHCFAICCLASILWLVCAYSLAFSDGGGVQARRIIERRIDEERDSGRLALAGE